ncbi:hypothetical protein WJX72_002659 [[Myrmecia] bisecta]|uniref:Amino acid transporter transmembrane domain-containing protein n=1 Tax=[Myrmecia] bisecta TaxID=41462 RepID=A0AAW1Q676_9CHLO
MPAPRPRRFQPENRSPRSPTVDTMASGQDQVDPRFAVTEQTVSTDPTLKTAKSLTGGAHLDDILDVSSLKDGAAGSEATGGKTSKAAAWAKSALTEGHTWWDAMLSSACSSIGQIILAFPNQMASTGVIAGIVLYMGTGFLSFYSIWLLITLFLDRKQRMVKLGTWYSKTDRHGYQRRGQITQYHDVIHYSLGKWWGWFTQFIVVLTIIGNGTTQIVASSSSQYVINKQFDKRQWGLIMGPVLCWAAFLPSMRSNRIMNIVGLVGTNYSVAYFFIVACIKGITPGAITRPPPSRQAFFNGAAVMGGGSGNFVAAIEMMDAMRQSRLYGLSFVVSVAWTFLLVIPHTTAVVLAYPDQSLAQGNIYSILPASHWKTASVYLMLIHNIAAFTVHTAPLMYIWERFVGTHTSRNLIRLPSRTPVVALLWLIAVAIPFYGTLNSLVGSFSPFLQFVAPALAYNWYYRTQERRDEAPTAPPGILGRWGWKPVFFLNWAIIVFFSVFGVGFEVYYSIVALVKNIHTFKFFAACYQCAGST